MRLYRFTDKSIDRVKHREEWSGGILTILRDPGIYLEYKCRQVLILNRDALRKEYTSESCWRQSLYL